MSLSVSDPAPYAYVTRHATVMTTPRPESSLLHLTRAEDFGIPDALCKTVLTLVPDALCKRVLTLVLDAINVKIL